MLVIEAQMSGKTFVYLFIFVAVVMLGPRHRSYRQCYIDHAERLRDGVVVDARRGLTAPQEVNCHTMRSLMVFK